MQTQFVKKENKNFRLKKKNGHNYIQNKDCVYTVNGHFIVLGFIYQQTVVPKQISFHIESC